MHRAGHPGQSGLEPPPPLHRQLLTAVTAQGVGHGISELIQELANMIALRTPIADVAAVIHAHPTYSEITRSVLQLALGKPADFVPVGNVAGP